MEDPELIHVKHHSGCTDMPGPHVHVPKTDELGRVMQVVWDDPEPPEDPIERRLRACEINLQAIWDELNARAASNR